MTGKAKTEMEKTASQCALLLDSSTTLIVAIGTFWDTSANNTVCTSGSRGRRIRRNPPIGSGPGFYAQNAHFPRVFRLIRSRLLKKYFIESMAETMLKIQ